MERLREDSFNEVLAADEPDAASAGYHFDVSTTV
jgi:hypothetical protein